MAAEEPIQPSGSRWPMIARSGVRGIERAVGRAKSIGRGLATGFTALATGHDLPELVVYFGHAPGDDLLCTAVLRELRKRGRTKLWMASNHPELFSGLSDAEHVIPLDQCHAFGIAWRRTLQQVMYSRYDGSDRSEPPVQHIIASLCESAGISGSVTLRPYLALKGVEIERAAWAEGYVAVQSSGLSARFPMRNKQWFPERFQIVVDALRKELPIVQLGSPDDPKLEGAKDMRGATTIREAAAILHHSRVNLGTVGMLMHAARAVECRSVIIYGGREAPWQSGYACNVNIYRAEPCAPCWRWNNCEIDRKCMRDISTADVLAAVRTTLEQKPGPLLEDVAWIGQKLATA